MEKRFLSLFFILWCVMPISPKVRQSSAVTIYVTACPHTHQEQCAWDNFLHDITPELNQWLDAQKKSVWTKVNRTFSHCSRRYFSVVRSDKHFGSITVSVPDCVNIQDAINQIHVLSRKKRISVAVGQDCPISIQRHTQSSEAGMEGYSLSLDALERVKHGGQLGSNDFPWSDQELKEALFWYQELPTTGLRVYEKPPYPFLPHFFTLWELAPHKGKGVKIAIIDTGVAAFPVTHSSVYKKNYDLEMQENFDRHNFNMVGLDGKDALEQLVLKLKPYIRDDAFNHDELERLAPEWIKELLSHSSCKNIENYLNSYGNEKKALGLAKIVRFIRQTFTIIHLDYPYNQEVIAQMMPLAKVSSRKSTLIAGHGSHTFGVVGGQVDNKRGLTPQDDIGICGLSPQADLIMIKAFQDSGLSNKSTLIAALKRAISYKVDIVNLSLKIADKVNVKDPSTALLDRLLGLVPYVVAASGNGSEQEAYPARFENVTFDVGAFKYSDDTYPILAFSQYKKDYGPKFVAPGYNILSSGLVPKQKQDSMYVFLSGTSMSAPIMTGFLALVLGEFEHDFSQDQLQTVIYKSAIKMHDTDDWRTKTLLGVVDMRTALFMLHVLRAVKQKIKNNGISYNVDKKFNNLVAAVHTLIFEPVELFGKSYLKTDQFQQSFADFYHKARKFRSSSNNDFNKAMKELNAIVASQSVDRSVNYIAGKIIDSLDAQVTIQQSLPSSIVSLSDILTADTVDLFPHLNAVAKKHLVKPKVVEQYWKEQADKLQSVTSY